MDHPEISAGWLSRLFYHWTGPLQRKGLKEPLVGLDDLYPLLPEDRRDGRADGRACGTCHGPAHTGKDRLVERAPVLPEQTLKEHPLGEYTADEQRLVFVEKARHGAFVSYSGSMPPLSLEALPDTDLADILQYLDLYKAP